ncbi:MAG: PucR family transcriptional regulator [Solirubrobacteraceae bacterium]
MSGERPRAREATPDDAPTLVTLAAEMRAEAAELAVGCTTYLVDSLPELQDAENLYWEETRSSTEANLDQVARLIRAGDDPASLVVPVETARWVRGLVRRGIGLPALLRAFRLGHFWLWERWSRTLPGRVPDPASRDAISDQLSAFLFGYIDRISDVMVETYGTERDRAARSSEQQRAETVRAILTGEGCDEEDASRRLGYDLRRHHVALRITSTSDAAGGLDVAAQAAARAAGLSEPLIIATGLACSDVWVGTYDMPGPELVARLEAFEPPVGVVVAVGNATRGPDGFRVSHQQACQAARIAKLAGSAAPPVTAYRRVELVSLLAADVPRARAFAADRLGALATANVATRRLRETVLLLLTMGGSAGRTAERLFVHPNTVAYRVKRAEQLLGRSITDEPTELACALILVEVLGDALFADDGTGPDRPKA